MRMTEDQAKTKWCPLVRVAGPMQTEAEGTSANRWAGQNVTAPHAKDYLCIASKCMAWRWHERTMGEAKAGSGFGYCGSFGRLS